MRNALIRRWQSRSPRERLVIVLLTMTIAAFLYLWLVQSAHRAREQLVGSVSRLRAEAVRLEKSAGEIARLRAAQAAPQQNAALQPDFRMLMQAQVESAGLARSLLRVEAVDASQVRVVFGAVPFSEWLAWVENMQSQQIRLDTTRIETLATAGLVSVTATFVRPHL